MSCWPRYPSPYDSPPREPRDRPPASLRTPARGLRQGAACCADRPAGADGLEGESRADRPGCNAPARSLAAEAGPGWRWPARAAVLGLREAAVWMRRSRGLSRSPRPPHGAVVASGRVRCMPHGGTDVRVMPASSGPAAPRMAACSLKRQAFWSMSMCAREPLGRVCMTRQCSYNSTRARIDHYRWVLHTKSLIRS